MFIVTYLCDLYHVFKKAMFLNCIQKNTMKKLLLPALFVSLWSMDLTSQITFTSTDLQEEGMTYVTKTDTLSIVDLGSASASEQSWDFSSLVMHYMSGPTFDLTSNTDYAADYPNSNLYTYGPAIMFGGFHGGAPVSEQGMDNGYMFWRKDVTGFWTEGFMADEGPYAGKKVWTVPQEMILGTPASLGSEYLNVSRWALTYDINPADVDTVYESNIDKSQTCDAWGSLITPTGTYPDVLRIHEYGIKVDSVKSYINGNPALFIEFSRDTFNNYIFITNGIHYPLAIVKADVNNTIKSIEYYFMQGPMGIEQLTTNTAKVYPNPSNGLISIDLLNSPTGNGQFVLSDTFGKIVGIHSLESINNQVDCTSLKAGIYFYKISTEGQEETGKIIIQ